MVKLITEAQKQASISFLISDSFMGRIRTPTNTEFSFLLEDEDADIFIL